MKKKNYMIISTKKKHLTKVQYPLMMKTLNTLGRGESPWLHKKHLQKNLEPTSCLKMRDWTLSSWDQEQGKNALSHHSYLTLYGNSTCCNKTRKKKIYCLCRKIDTGLDFVLEPQSANPCLNAMFFMLNYIVSPHFIAVHTHLSALKEIDNFKR